MISMLPNFPEKESLLNNTTFSPPTWNVSPHLSLEIRCPALSSASRQATCSGTEGWVSCDTAAKPRTTAEVVCRNGYIEDTTDLTRSRSVECNERGEWYPKPIKCFTGPSSSAYHQKITVNLHVRGRTLTWNETLGVVCPAVESIQVALNYTVEVKTANEVDVSVDVKGFLDDIFDP